MLTISAAFVTTPRRTKFGPPRALSPQQVEMARSMIANPTLSARQIAKELGVHRATLYRSLDPRRGAAS